MTKWQPDVLGAGFEALTFDLGVDTGPLSEVPGSEGRAGGRTEAQSARLAATLVRSLPKPLSPWDRFRGRRRPFEDVDVLYIHGWSDYFFQRHLAEYWTSRGARFFALDLRRYGRSLRPGQLPGYVESLGDYDTEIGLAITEMTASQEQTEPSRKLVLFGHSTGGLTLSLWADRHPGVADAVILNSPWIELQITTVGRQLIAPLVNLGAQLAPLEAAPQLDFGYYTRAQREVGPADELAAVNSEWRPEQTHAVHGGWLRAILAGHDAVHKGLTIAAPVCVLLSARSILTTKWREEFTRADSVLDVNEIAKSALLLGPSVTIERIDGALHDVFLSATQPRAEAYRRLDRWALGWRASLGGTAL